MARRAGIYPARAATAARQNATAARVAGSRDVENHVADEVRSRERAGEPEGQAGERQHQSFAQDHAQNCVGRRAERDPDADLVRPARDRIGNHANPVHSWGMSSGAVLALEVANRLSGIKKPALYEEPAARRVHGLLGLCGPLQRFPMSFLRQLKCFVGMFQRLLGMLMSGLMIFFAVVNGRSTVGRVRRVRGTQQLFGASHLALFF
jgi:hypothetical protein